MAPDLAVCRRTLCEILSCQSASLPPLPTGSISGWDDTERMETERRRGWAGDIAWGQVDRVSVLSVVERCRTSQGHHARRWPVRSAEQRCCAKAQNTTSCSSARGRTRSAAPLAPAASALTLAADTRSARQSGLREGGWSGTGFDGCSAAVLSPRGLGPFFPRGRGAVVRFRVQGQARLALAADARMLGEATTLGLQ